MKASQFVMRTAHAIQTNRAGAKIIGHWSDLLKYAWYFHNFRKWLKEGVVTFTYIKSDYTLREAKGTLNELLIPVEERPKGTQERKPVYTALAYYDLDKHAWRAFDIRLFVGYVTIHALVRKEYARLK